MAGELLANLGLPAWMRPTLDRIGVGWRPAVERGNPRRRRTRRAGWTFRERDGRGRTIGLHVRYRDGGKRHHDGTGRGLTVPTAWRADAVRQRVLFLVEGASDTITLAGAGLPVIGRPSNVGGVAALAELLRDLPAKVRIVVVGENDYKPLAHRWPGRAGAELTAAKLAKQLGRPVAWSLVPAGAKDSREWFTSKTKSRSGPVRWATLAAKFRAAVVGVAVDVLPTGPAEPMPVHEPRCPTPYHAGLKGREGGPRAGLFAAADCRCERWTCPGCPAVLSNRWRAWLWKCLLRYGAPHHYPRVPDDRGRLRPLAPCPAGPDMSRCGSWTLYAAVLDDRAAASLRSALSRLSSTAGRRVHNFVGLLVPKTAPICWSITESTEDPTDKITSQQTGRFFLVALDPTVKPPKRLRPISVDAAVAAVDAALESLHVEERSEGETKRNRPVTASPDWRPPVDRLRTHAWRRGERVTVPARKVRSLVAACGLWKPKLAVGDVQDSAIWGDGPMGELQAILLTDVTMRTTPDDFASRFEWWRQTVESVPFTPSVKTYLRQNAGRIPTADDTTELHRLAAADRDAAEAAERLEAELARYATVAFPPGIQRDIDEANREVERRRQDRGKRAHTYVCGCCRGRTYFPRPADRPAPCLACSDAGRGDQTGYYRARRVLRYDPPRDTAAVDIIRH